MTDDVLEFKIRFNDKRSWEETSITFTVTAKGGATSHTLRKLGNAVAEHLSRDFEAPVRWNIAGLKQGHYVEVKVSREDM